MQVDAYFPAGDWHSLWDGTHVDAGNTGRSQTLHVPLGHVAVHVRGGCVVPMQRAAPVTEDVRRSPLTLLVALPRQVRVPPPVKPSERHISHLCPALRVPPPFKPSERRSLRLCPALRVSSPFKPS